jgi:RHS repeat-associated protein
MLEPLIIIRYSYYLKLGEYMIRIFLFILSITSLRVFASQEQFVSPIHHSVNVITGDYCEAQTDLSMDGPYPIQVQRLYDAHHPSHPGWHFNHPGILSHHSPNLRDSEHNNHRVHYEYDNDQWLKCIQIADLSGQNVFNSAQFRYSIVGEKAQCIIETDSGDRLTYIFRSFDPTKPRTPLLLEEISKNDQLICSYQYITCGTEHLISRRNSPEGKFLINEYYYDGEHAGKVKAQYAPVGADNSPIRICNFIYHAGWTEAFDAKGTKTIYRYNDQHLLTSIEQYNEKALYRSERFFWNADKRLISRCLLDSKNTPAFCRTFEYDSAGNVIKKSLYGNLTGKSEVIFKLQPSGYPTESCERYSTRYSYSKENQLISETNDNGTSIHYEYDSNTKKISSKTICEGNAIRFRHFYFYDEFGLLIKKITDDGNGFTSNDLSNITERSVVDYTLRKTQPSFGKTEKIEEHFFDLETQSEKIFKITQNDYNSTGQLIRQDIYDKNGELEKKLCPSYDHWGRLNSTENGSEFAFDARGNVVKEKLQNIEIANVYDFADRCVHQEEKHANGYTQSSTFTYDNAGRKLSMTDGFGNTTRYSYDGLGRLITTVYPTVIDENDRSISHEEKREYDICDRVIVNTDANGYSTVARYNARGKPVSIEYPDGTHELFQYNLDGSLCQTIARDHTRAVYTHDYLARVIKTEYFDAEDSPKYPYEQYGEQNGLLFSGLTKSEKELSVKPTVPQDNDSHLCFNYNYINSLGQNVLQVKSTDDFGIITTTIFDARNRVENVITQNSLGKQLTQRAMRYDGIGNKILETHAGTYTLQWLYGPNNRLEQVIEAKNSPKQKITNYCYNERGQLQSVLKPDGVSVIYTYDAAGRIKILESSDKTIGYKYEYDASDNVIRVDDLVQQTATLRTYNDFNLVSEVLSNGLTLGFTYNAIGCLTKLTLPDQSGIEYDYDNSSKCTGLLRSIHRVNKSGKRLYNHTYTSFKNYLIDSEQLIGNLGEVQCTYDEKNRRISLKSPYWSEELPEGYDPVGNIKSVNTNDEVQRYQFDEQKRLVQEEGRQSHAYHYDSLSNLTIDNVCTLFDETLAVMQCGKTTYTYNMNGCPIEKRTDSKLIKYEYDALDRLIGVSCDDTSYKYTYDVFNRRLSKQTLTLDVGSQEWVETDRIRYIYDGNQEIGALSSDGTMTQLRVLGLGNPIAIELNGTPYAPLHDHRGSTVCLIDLQSRSIFETYHYSSFGAIQEDASCPWQFAGKRLDPETGLIYFGARYYDPELGRWMTPDPAGFIDGPNRFAYVNNNPISGLDQFGLFSWSDFWGGITSFFNTIADAISGATTYLQESFSFYNYAKPEIDGMANQAFGESFLELTGYYSDPGEVGINGSGEANDKVRITAINGILNIKKYAIAMMDLISSTHGGTNVHYVFYPSFGWTWDVVKGFFVKCGYISPEAYQLANTWKEMIAEMGGTDGGGLIIHYAHSLGGTNTMLAKKMLTPEELRMIRVITIGSATMIPNEDFESVINYVSLRDGVSLVDPFGHMHNENVVYIGSIYGAPLIDHFLMVETYQRLIAFLGKEFVESFIGCPN